MDARLSSLPHSAQAAVKDAMKALHALQRVLAKKTTIADRAARHCDGAVLRARKLRETTQRIMSRRPAA